MGNEDDLFQEFGTPADNKKKCFAKLRKLLQIYTWEEIADLYWEHRDLFDYTTKEKSKEGTYLLHHNGHRSFEEILDWILEQKGRRAKKEHLYAGSK